MEDAVNMMLEELEAAYQLTAAIPVSGGGVDHLAEVRALLRKAHRTGKQALEEAEHGGSD